jgi:hypothetical protein
VLNLLSRNSCADWGGGGVEQFDNPESGQPATLSAFRPGISRIQIYCAGRI